MRKWTEELGAPGGGSSEPPAWHYVWSELDPAEADPPSSAPRPLAAALPAAPLVLDVAYWFFLGSLALLCFFSARLALMKHFPRWQAQAKPEELLAQRDPEEMQLLQGIHLLEAMLCKIQRHLSQKERRRRQRRQQQQQRQDQ